MHPTEHCSCCFRVSFGSLEFSSIFWIEWTVMSLTSFGFGAWSMCFNWCSSYFFHCITRRDRIGCGIHFSIDNGHEGLEIWISLSFYTLVPWQVTSDFPYSHLRWLDPWLFALLFLYLLRNQQILCDLDDPQHWCLAILVACLCML